MDFFFRKIILTLIVWLLIHRSVTVLGQFQVQPSNAYAKVGDSVTLQCTVSNPGQIGNPQSWREYITSEAGGLISQDDKVNSGYVNDYVVQDQYHLNIPDVTLNHAGKYGCSDKDGNEIFVQLIVIESDSVLSAFPLTNPVLEGTFVRYSCTISYRGYWSPHIQWTGSKSGLIPHTNQTTNYMVKAYIDVEISRSNNGEVFQCFTSFGKNLDPSPGDNEASNIPDYAYSRNSSVLEVYYAPTNVSIVNQDGSAVTNITYTEDVQLSCISASNPPPLTIQWMHVEKGVILQYGQVLTITGPTALGLDAHTIRCTISNMLDDTLNIVGYAHAEISVKFLGTTTTETTHPQTSLETSGVPTSQCSTVSVTETSSETNTDTLIGCFIPAIVLGVFCIILLIVCGILAFKLRQAAKKAKTYKDMNKEKRDVQHIPSVYLGSSTSVQPGKPESDTADPYLMPVSDEEMAEEININIEQTRPLPGIPAGPYEELKEVTGEYMEPYTLPKQQPSVMQTIEDSETTT